MAAPDAGVYVEFMAPDLRFAVIVVLVVAWLAMTLRVRKRLTPLVALLLFVVCAFAVWLATTGNGRYFIPMLLAAGPLCIALICQLPARKSVRTILATLVVAAQGIVVYDNNPWHWWGLAPWNNAPFFEVSLDHEARAVPSTYVTVTPISYSIVAPYFPPTSRWINLSSQPDAAEKTPDVLRVQAILSQSKSLKLLIPSQPGHMTLQGLPNELIQLTINDLLLPQRLALKVPFECRLLQSNGLASQALRPETSLEAVAKFGFWVCSLQYPVEVPALPVAVAPSEIRRIFDTVEATCPRFFQTGQTSVARVEGGWLRVYPQADLRLYVMDSGHVVYKYWRTLNSVLMGTVEQFSQEGFAVNCKVIRGRSGMPWEREI